jgi:hypothetical protein
MAHAQAPGHGVLLTLTTSCSGTRRFGIGRAGVIRDAGRQRSSPVWARVILTATRACRATVSRRDY